MKSHREIKEWVLFNRRIADNSIEECYQERDNETQANRYEGQVDILTEFLEWLDEDTSNGSI